MTDGKKKYSDYLKERDAPDSYKKEHPVLREAPDFTRNKYFQDVETMTYGLDETEGQTNYPVDNTQEPVQPPKFDLSIPEGIKNRITKPNIQNVVTDLLGLNQPTGIKNIIDASREGRTNEELTLNEARRKKIKVDPITSGIVKGAIEPITGALDLLGKGSSNLGQGLQEFGATGNFDKLGRSGLDIVQGLLHTAFTPFTVPFGAATGGLNASGQIGKDISTGLNRTMNIPFDLVGKGSELTGKVLDEVTTTNKDRILERITGQPKQSFNDKNLVSPEFDKQANELATELLGLILLGKGHQGVKKFNERMQPVPNLIGKQPEGLKQTLNVNPEQVDKKTGFTNFQFEPKPNLTRPVEGVTQEKLPLELLKENPEIINLLKGKENVQEQSPTGVPIQSETGISEGVRKKDTETGLQKPTKTRVETKQVKNDRQTQTNVKDVAGEIISIKKPENITGKTSYGNWKVDYEVPSELGGTGKQTDTKYFWKKTDAANFYKQNKKTETPENVTEGITNPEKKLIKQTFGSKFQELSKPEQENILKIKSESKDYQDFKTKLSSKPPAERIDQGKDDIIDRIVGVSEKPIPNIESVQELKGTDGRWYSPLAIPFGLKTTGETRLVGYTYVDRNGSGFGSLKKTKQELIDDWNRTQKIQKDKFKEDLSNMNEEDFQNNVNYWLKEESKPEQTGFNQPQKKESSSEEVQLDELKNKKYKSSNDEIMIKILEKRINTPADKYKVGDGVFYKVAAGGKDSGARRGFRIIEIDKKNKEAVIEQVADTGLTSSGGDYDKLGRQRIHLGDLYRDKKYDKPPDVPRGAPTEPTNVAPKEKQLKSELKTGETKVPPEVKTSAFEKFYGEKINDVVKKEGESKLREIQDEAFKQSELYQKGDKDYSQADYDLAITVIDEIQKYKPETSNIPKQSTEKPKKISAKDEFKVGDVIETSEGLEQTIREVKGNSIYFTDEKGQDYSGFSRSTLRNLVDGGSWKRVEKSQTTEKQPFELSVEELDNTLKKIEDRWSNPEYEVKDWERKFVDEFNRLKKKTSSEVLSDLDATTEMRKRFPNADVYRGFFRNAISEGKIESHPDYPELSKPVSKNIEFGDPIPPSDFKPAKLLSQKAVNKTIALISGKAKDIKRMIEEATKENIDDIRVEDMDDFVKGQTELPKLFKERKEFEQTRGQAINEEDLYIFRDKELGKVNDQIEQINKALEDSGYTEDTRYELARLLNKKKEELKAKSNGLTDNNKTEALRMFGEGKKDRDIAVALGMKSRAGLDQVREWKKEFESEKKPKEDITKLEAELKRKEDAAKHLMGNKKGAWGVTTEADKKRSAEITKLRDKIDTLKQSENQVKPLKPETESITEGLTEAEGKTKSEIKQETEEVKEVIDKKLKPGLTKKTETTAEFNKKRDYIVNELQGLIDEVLDNGKRADNDNLPVNFRSLVQKYVDEFVPSEKQKETDFNKELKKFSKSLDLNGIVGEIKIQVPEDGIITLKDPKISELIQLRDNAKRLNWEKRQDYDAKTGNITTAKEESDITSNYVTKLEEDYTLKEYNSEIADIKANLEEARKNKNKNLIEVFETQLKQFEKKVDINRVKENDLTKEAFTYPAINKKVRELPEYQQDQAARNYLDLVKEFGFTKKDEINLDNLELASRIKDNYKNIDDYIAGLDNTIERSNATLNEFKRKDGKQGYVKTNKGDSRRIVNAISYLEDAEKKLREIGSTRPEIEKLLATEPKPEPTKTEVKVEKTESENAIVDKYADIIVELNVKDQIEYLKENKKEIPSDEVINQYRERSKQQNIAALNKLKDAIDNKDYKTLSDLLHTGNKNYRKFFAEYTDKKLPDGEGKTKEALREFTGFVEAPKEEVVKLTEAERKAKMEEARNESILSKKLNYSGFGTLTRKEFIDKVTEQGWKPETMEVKAIQDPTRTRFNRMDQREQDAFAKRQEEAGMKTEYLVRSPEDRSSYTITKAEYDYALSKSKSEPKPLTEQSKESRIVSDEAYKKAKENLGDPKKINLKGGLGTVEGAKVLKDLTIVGAYHFENGLRKFGGWAKKMIEEFGDKIKPRLREIWDNLDRKSPRIQLDKALRDTKVRNEKGDVITVYSGHSNTPLYGEFDPKKATSGGFYASENPQIASGYAMGKFGVKEYYENGSQYRIKGKNGEYNKKIWQIELTEAQKRKLDELAELKNEYGEHEYRINEIMSWAKDNRDYEPLARRILARGKYDLQSIWDYNEQMGYNIAYLKENKVGENIPEFLRQRKNDTEQIMDALGIDWQSYDWIQPGVYPIYLNIKNPLDADLPFPRDLLKALKDKAKYERERNNNQIGWTTWTKDYPLKEWIRDIEEGSEGWTTQVPKKALPILKQFGYDGIKERGNKGAAGVLPREQRDINWIAFDKEQVIPKYSRASVTEQAFTQAKQRLISDEVLNTARENIKQKNIESLNKLGSGLGKLDPSLLKDYAVIGAYHLETVVRAGIKTGTEFRNWAKEMIADLGESIKPHLKAIWAEVAKDKDLAETLKPYRKETVKPIGKIVEPVKIETVKKEVVTPEKPKKVETDFGSGEVRTRGLAASVEARSIAKGITDGIENLPTYKVEHNLPKIDEASKIIAENPERALDIIEGKEFLDKKDMEGFLTIGLEDYAVRNDPKLLIRIAKAEFTSEKGTEYGRFIQSLRNQNPLSPRNAIRDIIEARQESSAFQRQEKLKAEYDTKIKELEEKLKLKDEALESIEAEKSYKKLQRETKIEQRREKRNYTRQELKLERDDLYKDLAKTFTVNVGFTADQVIILGKLTKNYAREGILSAEAVVDAIYNQIADKLEGVTKKDIRDAISGYGREVKTRTKDELQTAMNDLRQQMKTISRIEELESGKTPVKKEVKRTEPSEELSNLRSELKTVLDEHGITDYTNLEKAKKMIKNKIVEYHDKINSGDYSKQKRGPVLDEERTKLQKELDDIRDKWKYVQKTLGEVISEPEAKQIAELSRIAAENKVKLEGTKRSKWNEKRTPEELAYAEARVNFADYVNGLKESADKLTWEDFKQDKFGTVVRGAKHIPGLAKSSNSTFDNSALFNQGWAVLMTHPTIWQRNAIQSFRDIIKSFGKENVYKELSKDIISREYYDEMVKDKTAINVIEEALPDAKILEKIPYVGRLVKAADIAYTGFQFRNRADLYGLYREIAKQQNKTTTDLGIGNLVNTLTARGSLGRAETLGNAINVAFFSLRNVKSKVDFLTHPLGLDFAGVEVTPFMRKQAAINLLKMVAGASAIFTTANALMPGSVNTNPFSANFGQIKVGDTKFNVTGGLSSVVVLALRLGSTITNTLGVTDIKNYESSSGKESKLSSGKYGAQTGWDVLDNFFKGKLSPTGGIARDFLMGQTMDREPVTLKNQLGNLITPLPFKNLKEVLDDPQSAPLLAAVIADGLGIFTNTYSNDPNLNKVKNAILSSGEEKFSEEKRGNFYRALKQALKDNVITKSQYDNYKTNFEESQAKFGSEKQKIIFGK